MPAAKKRTPKPKKYLVNFEDHGSAIYLTVPMADELEMLDYEMIELTTAEFERFVQTEAVYWKYQQDFKEAYRRNVRSEYARVEALDV